MIEYVRHEAALNRKTDDGSTVRAHVEASARGRPLPEGPVCPDVLRYLVDWAYQLHGRSGVDMSGAAPLSYTTIAHWSALTGTAVEPHEVAALIHLDSVIRHPDEPEEAAAAAEPAPTPAWPTRKVTEA